MDACELAVHQQTAVMVEWSAGYPDAWIDDRRGTCAMISAAHPWVIEMPAPTMTPDRQ